MGHKTSRAVLVGLDDDLIGVPDDLQVGLTDALTGAPVIPSSDFNFSDLSNSLSFATPATLADAMTEAQNFDNAGVTLATDITNLPSTDYADTALDNALSTADQWILPAEILTIGELAYGF
jgi:hypothetical protein